MSPGELLGCELGVGEVTLLREASEHAGAFGQRAFVAGGRSGRGFVGPGRCPALQGLTAPLFTPLRSMGLTRSPGKRTAGSNGC